jgi:nucleotide-binding universal stress UspA family protein
MSGRIVVGYDGSAAAHDALRWAADEARRRQATLEAVSAWEIPITAGVVLVDLADDAELAAKQRLADALAALDLPADMPVETYVLEGAAGPLLTRVARGADLLVVGSRGHGGFSGLLLGSVSSYCAHHATCPVVILRHTGGRQ